MPVGALAIARESSMERAAATISSAAGLVDTDLRAYAQKRHMARKESEPYKPSFAASLTWT